MFIILQTAPWKLVTSETKTILKYYSCKEGISGSLKKRLILKMGRYSSVRINKTTGMHRLIYI